MDWDAILQIGRELGVDAEVLRKWRTRGVPFRYHVPLIERMRARGLAIDIDELRSPPESGARAGGGSTAWPPDPKGKAAA